MLYALRSTQIAVISIDGIFKGTFMNEKYGISIWISLNFVLKGPIDYKSALVQVMVWRR